LYAERRVPHPSTIQIRPIPYVLVLSMASATSWSLLPRSDLVLRISIFFAPDGRP